MTKSPASNGKADPGLSEDRTSSIGWLFITSYYEFYNTQIENIHKIYQSNASLSHGAFPGSSDEETIHKAQGTDAIIDRFKNDQLRKNGNRIVITDAEFQVSSDKNILIVVFGEWSKEDSPYHQFTQTFVLVPGKKENTFDVANDVLRFVGAKVNAPKTKVVPEPVKEEPKEAQDAEPAVEVKKESVKESVKEITNTPEPAKELVSEISEVEEAVEAEPVKEDTEEPVKEEKKEGAEEPTEKVESSPEIDSDTSKASSQPMSWAALASQAAAKVVTKPVPAPGVAKVAPVKKAAPPPSNQNGKFKKEEWFPIYIRGIKPGGKQLDEKVLRDHISKKFGELKFFRPNANIALCDFVSLEAQKKALEAKETVIDGVTIFLEPRESKTGNSFHKKFSKDQKEKPSNDPKRKVEKKITPAKKTTKQNGRQE